MTETEELSAAVLQLAGAVEVIRQGIAGLPSGTEILSHAGSQRPHLAVVSDRLTAISRALPDAGASAWLAPLQKRAGITPADFGAMQRGKVGNAIDAIEAGSWIEVRGVRNFLVLEDGEKFLIAIEGHRGQVNIVFDGNASALLVERIKEAERAASAARMVARDRDYPGWNKPEGSK